jgi:hypothetical protein
MLKNVLTICDFSGRANPKFLLWIFEALSFDVLHLTDGEVFLFSPFETLVKEVKHRKIERPNIVSSGQINVIVGVQTCKGDRSAEISLSSSRNRLFGYLVNVTFGEPKVNYKNSAGLSTEHKITSFDVTMNETTLVNFFNRSEHLNKYLNDNLEGVVRFKTTPRFGQINPHKVHNYKVLLRVVYEVIDVRNMRAT